MMEVTAKRCKKLDKPEQTNSMCISIGTKSDPEKEIMYVANAQMVKMFIDGFDTATDYSNKR